MFSGAREGCIRNEWLKIFSPYPLWNNLESTFSLMRWIQRWIMTESFHVSVTLYLIVSWLISPAFFVLLIYWQPNGFVLIMIVTTTWMRRRLFGFIYFDYLKLFWFKNISWMYFFIFYIIRALASFHFNAF